jgi:uncharacterized protein (TIGR02271 family)
MTASTVHDQRDQTIELVEEQLHLDKRVVELGRARVDIEVQTREELVELLLHEEEVRVDRTLIGQPVDVIPPIREEEGVLVVPVVEERLVAKVQLVLKEELRITKRVTEEMVRTVVPLRSEHATVRRVDEPDPGPAIRVTGEQI